MSDPKPPRRVRDPELLAQLHARWRGTCALDELGDCEHYYSLHHIHRHPRDDVEPNLVMLCGDGTTGHHGLITAEDRQARAQLGLYIVTYRLDTLSYLEKKLGGEVQAAAWLSSRFPGLHFRVSDGPCTDRSTTPASGESFHATVTASSSSSSEDTAAPAPDSSPGTT